jgi:hypothetical protein
MNSKIKKNINLTPHLNLCPSFNIKGRDLISRMIEMARALVKGDYSL